MGGSLLTVGNPIYLDKSKEWKMGMNMIIDAVQVTAASLNIKKILSNMTKVSNTDTIEFLKDRGFAWRSAPNFYQVRVYQDKAAWLASIKSNYRRYTKKKLSDHVQIGQY